ncbi:hypothetical protein [Variovorax sp. OV329]|uniref:hypothetical protein n=1 Tax=Variovorax sp. OV329 TaxID=1882825 RepID=UPI0008F115CA|nr:hypothetical protein [Variovorax sp. OV329]SFN25499.1 hypothetical protein SAMN05444747_119101 [Variovorax sp. OV329]
MTQHPSAESVKAELGRLVSEFFGAVSFEEGGAPAYGRIRSLFIEQGLLIKNVSPVPEISTIQSFIEPREAMVRKGELTRFLEEELSEVTQVFGNVAQRFSAYSKGGTMNGKSFTARGMVCTQFILTPAGWRMSSMAWDDERPGLSLPAA